MSPTTVTAKMPGTDPVADAAISTLAAQLGARLRQLHAQVACAESCTGGGIAEAITRIAGSSAWFELGIVSYSNAQKSARLQVPAELFVQWGAVSEAVVRAMAQGVQQLSGARFAVAVSGVAGPAGGTEEKPVGTVCFGFADGQRFSTQTRRFNGSREQIRRQTVEAALQGLLALM